jgi:hypothetical protein
MPVAEAHERQKLVLPCRYIIRPVISEQRLSLYAQCWVSYQLRTSYRDDTPHVVLEPLDFMGAVYIALHLPMHDRYQGQLAFYWRLVNDSSWPEPAIQRRKSRVF